MWIGHFYTDDNSCHSFIYDNGIITDLGTLGGKNTYAKRLMN